MGALRVVVSSQVSPVGRSLTDDLEQLTIPRDASHSVYPPLRFSVNICRPLVAGAVDHTAVSSYATPMHKRMFFFLKKSLF